MKTALVSEEAESKKYMPGSSALGVCSRGLGWDGFELIEYHGDQGERPEMVVNRYILGLWDGQVATGERISGRGGEQSYVRYPGTITVIPPSVINAHRAHNSYRVVLCFLDPTFLNSVREEADRRAAEELQFRPNIDDPPARELITLLATEAGEGGLQGRLYADHLAHSIAIRLLSQEGAGPRISGGGSLPRRLLGRVLERMNDLTTNLDLASLAAETGYSRWHFLRMFRAATGCTPHRYLLQLRVNRAKELMRLGPMPLIDIAAECGFSSQAHMSKVFRQLLGVSPGRYRREL